MYIEMGSKKYYDFFTVVGIFLLFEKLDIVNNPFYREIMASKQRSKNLEEKFLRAYPNYDLKKYLGTIIKFTKNIVIFAPQSSQGFIKINSEEELEYGIMEEYKHIFNNYKTTLTERQFLLCQYNNAMRMIRLYSKHIPKSEKLESYFKSIGINSPSWLLKKESTINLMNKFNDYFCDALFKDSYNKLEQESSSSNIVNLFVTLDNFFAKLLILVAYNTLVGTSNNPVGYAILVDAIQQAFKRYIPKNPEAYEPTIAKILDLNEPNYTFKLFSTVYNKSAFT